ncbi:MAG: BlaI/MecI/CopY family transcriptional regulator [Lachnospiraceae bacterium]|nr:BlaI/MecI/CopY family transcriptional regulator [Lachnospiraceae bacterium]
MQYLTKRELEVMKILWDAKTSCIVADFLNINPALSRNTVNNVINKLLKKNYIVVADVIQTKTVMARAFRPLISREQYLSQEMNISSVQQKKTQLLSNMTGLLAETSYDSEFVKQLEDLLDEYKKK